MHPAAIPVESLLQQCRLQTTRRSGPGGQHRNKVETAVVIEHLPSGIRAEASERRSQDLNRTMAIFRLRIRLAVELRTLPTKLTDQPSPLWMQRRSGSKLVVSVEHADFPALLAEALDHLARFAWDLPPAAALLGISGSQLAKLLQSDPASWQLVCAARSAAGLRKLHG